MNDVALSVVIPWCDRPEIRETLMKNRDALVRAGAEVVVVDCGGVSGALEQLVGGVDLPTLRLVRVDADFNKCLALNIGVHAAGGTIIAFLDADLVLLPGFIVEMLAALTRGAFVTVDRVYESEPPSSPRTGSALCEIVHTVKFAGPAMTIEVETNRVRYADRCRSGPGIVFLHRDEFIKVGGMNSDLEGWGWEDLDLVVRLIRNGLVRKEAGAVVHLSHGDDHRAGGHARRTTEAVNFTTCAHNYALGHFLGTYDDDASTWQPRLSASAR